MKKENKSFFFVGIKGSGMSALAMYLHEKGYIVSGSDKEEYFFTEDNLIKNNIEIFKYGEQELNKFDYVVRGNSIKDDNLDIINYHKITYSYTEIINEFQELNLIAVSGVHGKTTTSTFLSQLLKTSYIIGDGNGSFQDTDFLTVEACEYKDTFLAYKPYYLIITNIDYDHSDYFKNLEHVKKSFNKLIDKSSIVLMYGDDIKINKYNVITYGFKKDNDIVITIKKSNNKGFVFDIIYKDLEYSNLETNIIGKHNLLNLVSALSILHFEGNNLFELDLNNMKYPKRRFNVEKIKNNIIIDDYAHHPNEIKACIKGIRQKYDDLPINIVFQPHTYSRTNEFYNEFIEAFKGVNLYIDEVFSSERENKSTFDRSKFITNIENAKIFNSVNDLLNIENEIIVFMGAGNVDKYKKIYISLIK